MTTNHQPNPRSEQVERLLTCAEQANIYRGPEGIPYALIPGDTLNQCNVATLRSQEFSSFLREDYHDKYGEFPDDDQIRVARNLLDRRAARRTYTAPPSALRVARGNAEHARLPGDPQHFREAIALDLGRSAPDAQDLVLEIDQDGWSVNNCSDFTFVRPRGSRPIPPPEPAGPEALHEFKDLLRVDDNGFHRILTWLLAAMRPKGPYPILVLQGETGSGKSLAAAMLRNLLDPAEAPFQPLPAAPNALLGQAHQTWIQAFDHITAIPKEIQTALCRLSTRAAFNIPTDPRDYRMTVSLSRPILLTVPTQASGAAWRPRPDLLDRTLTATLPKLTPQTRRPESEIEERFEKLRPQILGALAQAISVAMSREKELRLETYPRHAEAAIWAIAAFPEVEAALQQASEFQLPKDPLIDKVVALMATGSPWQGSATKLRLDLDVATAPNHLSRKLKEVQELLKLQGIEIAFPRRQEEGQTIQITKTQTTPSSLEVAHALMRAASTLVSTPLPPRQTTNLTIVPKPDRQIVSAEQNKAKSGQPPHQPDRHPASAEPPAEPAAEVDQPPYTPAALTQPDYRARHSLDASDSI